MWCGRVVAPWSVALVSAGQSLNAPAEPLVRMFHFSSVPFSTTLVRLEQARNALPSTSQMSDGTMTDVTFGRPKRQEL